MFRNVPILLEEDLSKLIIFLVYHNRQNLFQAKRDVSNTKVCQHKKTKVKGTVP